MPQLAKHRFSHCWSHPQPFHHGDSTNNELNHAENTGAMQEALERAISMPSAFRTEPRAPCCEKAATTSNRESTNRAKNAEKRDQGQSEAEVKWVHVNGLQLQLLASPSEPPACVKSPGWRRQDWLSWGWEGSRPMAAGKAPDHRDLLFQPQLMARLGGDIGPSTADTTKAKPAQLGHHW